MKSNGLENRESFHKEALTRQAPMEQINAAMIKHVREIAREIGANAGLAYVDVIISRDICRLELVPWVDSRPGAVWLNSSY